MQPNSMFRSLSEPEVIEFKRHIRATYTAGQDISELWHPLARAECELINFEDVQLNGNKSIELMEG
jgi:hypothetical protein